MATRCSVLLVLLVGLNAPILAQDRAIGGQNERDPRPFTVRDGIEMAYFGNIFVSSPANSYDDGTVSPDGRFAIKITHRGVLLEGVTEGTMWLFDVADVIRSVEDQDPTPPAPTALVRMSAAINGYSGDFRDRDNVLLHPRWSEDARSVYFLGRDGQENRRLYRVDIDSREITMLSRANQDVIEYSLVGKQLAYLAAPNVDVDELWRSAGAGIPDIVVGTGTPLIPLLFPNFLAYTNVEPVNLEVWRVREGSAEPVTDQISGRTLLVSSNLAEADISISPDGGQAVAVISGAEERADNSTGATYRIIDLDTGAFRDSTDLEAVELEWAPFAQGETDDSAALQFDVIESLNEPPVLVATISETGQSRTVFDPNPQLANIELLPVGTIEWQDRHGRMNTGGLIKPANFEAGRRYPLVIQTHGFRRSRFFRVGFSDTATAGRALASRGLVVVQADEALLPSEDDIDSPINLVEAGLDVYLGAVDKLAADGMVDPEKVGISGYSFSGLTVATAITRAPERFAAAVMANTDPLTMTGYFSYVDSPLHGVTERLLIGAAPFEEGIQKWIDKSPSMSISAISAPVLISAADPMHLLSLWDFYAALRYQGKAVELQYIRSGKHNIAKPLHKVAHQEMMVDWFDFWLNNREDPDPGKGDQYRRWRLLRQDVQ